MFCSNLGHSSGKQHMGQTRCTQMHHVRSSYQDFPCAESTCEHRREAGGRGSSRQRQAVFYGSEAQAQTSTGKFNHTSKETGACITWLCLGGVSETWIKSNYTGKTLTLNISSIKKWIRKHCWLAFKLSETSFFFSLSDDCEPINHWPRILIPL